MDGDNPFVTKLRKSREPLAGLVHAWLDDVLERPVGDLLDKADLARALATGLRGLAADPRNEDFLRGQIAVSLKELAELKAPGRLPQRAIMAVRNLAAQPFVLDQTLVAALLDHEAAHVLLREVLQQSLVGFTRQVMSWLPGGQTAFWLMGQAQELAAAAAGEIGTSIEERVNSAVDEALAPALDLAARRIADDNFSRQMSDWRGHVFDVLLKWPARDLVSTLEQVDPEELARHLAGFLRAIAASKVLEKTIEKSLGAALERAGRQSLRQMLSGTSVEKDWRPALEKQLVDSAWPFVQSAAFDAWLKAVSKGSRELP